MRARKGEHKRQLLDEARAIAAARGFAALTPATLAESMELTTAQVSRSFRSAAALRRAVLDDLRDETFPAPTDVPQAPTDPAGRLLAWLNHVRKEAARPSAGFRLLVRALLEITGGDGRADLHAHLLEWSKPLIRLLQECQRAGVVRRSLDPQVAAWDLQQAILGHALLGPRDPALDEAAMPFDSLLQGVMKVDV